MLKSILLIIFATAIALLLGESAVRILAPQNLSGSWLETTSRGYTVNKSHGQARHQFNKIVTYYHFTYPHLRATPLPVNYPTTKILVLGDSFTFGWLLPWQDTYVYQLQQYASQQLGKHSVKFLNAATGGWGTADYLAYTEEFGKVVKPNIVLVFLNTDDIGRSVLSNLYHFKQQSGLALTAAKQSNRQSRLKLTINKIPFYHWLLEHSALFQLTRKVYLVKSGLMGAKGAKTPPIPYHSFPNISAKYAQRLGSALFKRLNQWCQTHDAKLIVVTTGFFLNYPKNVSDPTQAFSAIAAKFFKKQHIPFFDISPQFQQAAQNKMVEIPQAGHPNQLGANIIAKLVWPWLQNQIESTPSFNSRHSR